MLTGVDTSVECLKQLIVAIEKSLFVDRFVATIDSRVETGGLNDDRFVDRRNDECDSQLETLGRFVSRNGSFKASEILSLDPNRDWPIRHSEIEVSVSIRHASLFAATRRNDDLSTGNQFVQLRHDH